MGSYSRHYYDLYKLAVSRLRASALADTRLLQDVVALKQPFYPSVGARYDLALPGTLKLLPATTSQVRDLERDYDEMQVMCVRRGRAKRRLLQFHWRISSVKHNIGPANWDLRYFCLRDVVCG